MRCRPAVRSTWVAGRERRPSTRPPRLAGHSRRRRRPSASARVRGEAAGVDVDWRRYDAGLLLELDLDPGVTLIHDRGCFHGLGDTDREGCARGVTALAAPGATFLLMSFAPNGKPVGPSGASEEELRERFGEAWELVEATPVTERPSKGPMVDVPLTWYRFKRRGG